MTIEEMKERYYKENAVHGHERYVSAYINALEIDNIGYGYACQHLRYLMGLDNTKEDLSECFEKLSAIKDHATQLEAELLDARARMELFLNERNKRTKSNNESVHKT